MADDVPPEMAAEIDSALNDAAFDVPSHLLWPTTNAIIELMAALDPTNIVFQVACEALPNLHPSAMSDTSTTKYQDDLRDWLRETWLQLGEWLRRRRINFIQWESELDGQPPLLFFIGAPPEVKA